MRAEIDIYTEFCACTDNSCMVSAQQIYQAYTGRGSANQEGLPLQSALQILRTKGVNLQPHELLNHVRQLCDDGRLYSTIDDEHHKPTSEDF